MERWKTESFCLFVCFHSHTALSLGERLWQVGAMNFPAGIYVVFPAHVVFLALNSFLISHKGNGSVYYYWVGIFVGWTGHSAMLLISPPNTTMLWSTGKSYWAEISTNPHIGSSELWTAQSMRPATKRSLEKSRVVSDGHQQKVMFSGKFTTFSSCAKGKSSAWEYTILFQRRSSLEEWSRKWAIISGCFYKDENYKDEKCCGTLVVIAQ